MKKLIIFIFIVFGFTINAQSLYTVNGTSEDTPTHIEWGNLTAKIKSLTIINDATVTDTLFISFYSDFPENETIKRLGGEGTTFSDIGKYEVYLKFGTYADIGKNYRVEVVR